MIRNQLLLLLFLFSTCLIVGNEAIIGGDISKLAPFRYQVSVQLSGSGYVCGGGIIGEKFILTAAHCVIENNGAFRHEHISIIAGTKDLYSTAKPVKTIDVTNVFVPRAYEAWNPNRVADIAVLKLKDSLHQWYHRNLKKLDLPHDDKDNFDGNIAKIAGYGWYWVSVNKLGKESGSSDNLLRYAETIVIADNSCQFMYGHEKKIHEQHLCARVKQRTHFIPSGVCRGDDGGPLVIDGKTVIGILSQSPLGCSERSQPGLYTRVSKYLKFIENSMKGKKSPDIIKYNVH